LKKKRSDIPIEESRLKEAIKNIEKLYSEKLGNYRVFLDTEKGLNFNKKGRKI
jgi:hypothetical protein